MIERTTVRLPEELLSRARRKAVAEGRTLTSLIEDGLRIVVAEGGEPSKAKRPKIPVSRQTGGLRPGIDLDDLSKLQEIDDLEYVRRMSRMR